MTKADILNEAIEVVGGRGKSYGRPEDNFDRIARRWRVHLFNRHGAIVEIDASDVAAMMIDMKLARLENDPKHHDSIVDVLGYGACWGEIAGRGP